MSRLRRAASWVARKLGWNLSIYADPGSLEVYWSKIRPVVRSEHPISLVQFVDAIRSADYQDAFVKSAEANTWDWTKWLNDATLKVQQREASDER